MTAIANRTRNKKYMYSIDGVCRSIATLVKKYGADCDLVYARIKRGWDIHRALTTPTRVPAYASRKVESPRWNPHVRQKYEFRNCLKCGNDFGTWLAEDKKFCSRKCSNSYKAKFYPIWNKGKKAGDPGVISGSRNWNWKGAITSRNRAERQRFHEVMQPTILARDNYTCQICDAYGVPIQVDHIKRWSEYPELRFVESNCRTLCMACHYYVTFGKKLPEGLIWGHNLGKVAS